MRGSSIHVVISGRAKPTSSFRRSRPCGTHLSTSRRRQCIKNLFSAWKRVLNTHWHEVREISGWMQASNELLLSARLADRFKSLAAPVEWELASVIHELGHYGKEYHSHLSSAPFLPAREECQTAAILAAAQAAARTGNTDALEDLMAYAVRYVAQLHRRCRQSAVIQVTASDTEKPMAVDHATHSYALCTTWWT